MEEEYVEGLSGEEIVVDIAELIASKLREDCNLRSTDAYMGGYDGTIEIHLNLRALDTAVVKTKIVMGAGRAAVEEGDTVVDVKLDIPLEPSLNLVRERSGQGVPTLARDEEGRTVVKKRHYGKHALVAAGGGATGETL